MRHRIWAGDRNDKRCILTSYTRKTHTKRDLPSAAAQRAAGVRVGRTPPLVQGGGGRAAHHAGRREPPSQEPRGIPRHRAVPPRGTPTKPHPPTHTTTHPHTPTP